MSGENMGNGFMYKILVFFAFASYLSTAATSCAIGLGAIGMLVDYIRHRRWPAFDRRLLHVLLVYCVVQCIIAALSLDPQNSFKDVGATIYRFLPLLFALGYIRTENEKKGILLAAMLSILIDAGNAAVQAGLLHWPRSTGFNTTPTFLSAFMLMGIPIAAYVSYDKGMTRWARRLAALTLLLSLLALFASGTRGAWIALAVMGIVAAILIGAKYRRLVLKLFALGAAAFILLAVLFPTSAFRPHSTTDERFLMWESALHIIEDYPLHGAGQNEYGLLYNTKYISPLAQERSDPGNPSTGHGHPHNNILKVTAEGGVLGFAAFLLLHGYILYMLWQQYGREKAAGRTAYALVGIMILLGLHMEGMTDTNFNQVPIMRAYWLLIGTMLAQVPVGAEKNNTDL